jgi:hypothetical protein
MKPNATITIPAAHGQPGRKLSLVHNDAYTTFVKADCGVGPTVGLNIDREGAIRVIAFLREAHELD